MDKRYLYIDELNYINSEIIRNRKSIWTTYILAILIGYTGAHRFYVGKNKSAIGKLALSGLILLLSIVATFIPIHMENPLVVLTQLVFGVSIMWGIVDLVVIPKWLNDIDSANKYKALEEVIIGRSEINKEKGDEYEQKIED